MSYTFLITNLKSKLLFDMFMLCISMTIKCFRAEIITESDKDSDTNQPEQCQDFTTRHKRILWNMFANNMDHVLSQMISMCSHFNGW